ncbi:hypothetical protein FALBO_5887 [Fusarium albosuccineum]|uniref:Uncharacterized protein n=1 Tax=Fusarium albosuccineum TaxID=1237068 RepID=A0A8H4LCR6_9HYPO|nr:hypothetical protein FALBO_5887 [Fusarium albosuccineum]
MHPQNILSLLVLFGMALAAPPSPLGDTPKETQTHPLLKYTPGPLPSLLRTIVKDPHGALHIGPDGILRSFAANSSVIDYRHLSSTQTHSLAPDGRDILSESAILHPPRLLPPWNGGRASAAGAGRRIGAGELGTVPAAAAVDPEVFGECTPPVACSDSSTCGGGCGACTVPLNSTPWQPNCIIIPASSQRLTLLNLCPLFASRSPLASAALGTPFSPHIIPPQTPQFTLHSRSSDLVPVQPPLLVVGIYHAPRLSAVLNVWATVARQLAAQRGGVMTSTQISHDAHDSLREKRVSDHGIGFVMVAITSRPCSTHRASQLIIRHLGSINGFELAYHDACCMDPPPPR